VHKWSDYPEVNNAVDEIYSDLKRDPDFRGRENLKKKHIKVVVLDLYAKWLTDPSLYSSYHRNVNQYKAKSRYNALHISKAIISVIDAMIERGFIEHKLGYYGREEGQKSRISRMRAADKLIDLIVKDHCFTEEMIDQVPDRESIILRTKDEITKVNTDIEYEDTNETNRMRVDLAAYNSLLRRTHIDIPHFPKEGVLGKSKKRRIKINRSDKFVRRVFNNESWKEGGRFYNGWWQHVPQEWREKIRINNEPTIELDYSGLHIALLYALEGEDYWVNVDTDPYQLGQGFEVSARMRDLVKLVLLSLINASTQKKAIQAVQQKINKNADYYKWMIEEGVKLTDIVERFMGQHEKIRCHFGTGIGTKMQNVDSMMAAHVINGFTALDIPVLCVHDSFIVTSDHENQLEALMSEATKQVLSYLNKELNELNLRVKSHEMEVISFPLIKHRRVLLSQITPIPDDVLSSLNLPLTTTRRVLLDLQDNDYQKRWEDHKGMDWEEDYFRPSSKA
jgi:hypothetical protein